MPHADLVQDRDLALILGGNIISNPYLFNGTLQGRITLDKEELKGSAVQVQSRFSLC
jgi:hypothetical protein